MPTKQTILENEEGKAIRTINSFSGQLVDLYAARKRVVDKVVTLQEIVEMFFDTRLTALECQKCAELERTIRSY